MENVCGEHISPHHRSLYCVFSKDKAPQRAVSYPVRGNEQEGEQKDLISLHVEMYAHLGTQNHPPHQQKKDFPHLLSF